VSHILVSTVASVTVCVIESHAGCHDSLCYVYVSESHRSCYGSNCYRLCESHPSYHATVPVRVSETP
jgi:hypothetical protein